MSDVGLALRLVRGCGARDVLRLGLLALGVAAVVAGLLVGLAGPQVAADGQRVSMTRSPDREGPGLAARSDLRTSENHDELEGRPWTRVVVSGASASAPLPPGLVAWPAPGQTVASPALAAGLTHHPVARAGLGTLVPEAIDEAGLTGPDELFSYTVLPADVPPLDGQRVVAFGGPGTVDDLVPGWLLPAEIVVLVLLPAVVFLVVLLRAAISARGPRTRALFLVGMTPRRCGRVFGWEMTVVALVGSVLGVLVYREVEGPLGASGLLGGRWWPRQAHVGVVPSVVLVLLVTLVVGRVARGAMSRSLERRRTERASKGVGLAGRIGLVLLTPAVACLAWTCVRLSMLPAAGEPPPSALLAALGATLAAVLGLTLATPAVLRSGATALADRVAGPALRLGLRSVAARAGHTGPLAAFVALLVVVSGFGAGVLAEVAAQATGDGRPRPVSLQLVDVPSGERARVASIVGRGAVLTVDGEREGASVDVVVGECDDLVTARLVAAGDCVDEPQVGAFGGAGDVDVPLVTGGRARVATPTGPQAPSATWDVKLPPSAAPWAVRAAHGQVETDVAPDRAEALSSALHSMDARAAVDVGQFQQELLAPRTEQAMVVRAGAGVGIALALAAFLLSSLELWWAGRRSSATLVAIGVPRRVMQVSATTQFAAPVAVAGAVAVVIGTLAGWCYLAYWSTAAMFDAGVLVAAALPALLATGLALLAGLVAGRERPSVAAMADA